MVLAALLFEAGPLLSNTSARLRIAQVRQPCFHINMEAKPEPTHLTPLPKWVVFVTGLYVGTIATLCLFELGSHKPVSDRPNHLSELYINEDANVTAANSAESGTLLTAKAK